MKAAAKILIDSYQKPEPKFKMKENREHQSWEELVAEAEKNGYVETQLEDVLTLEEIKKADERYQEIQREFSQKTKLDKLDLAFLFLAVALQCARQYILSNDKFRIDASKADNAIKNPLKKRIPKEWQEILIGSVPYDATTREDKNSESTGLSGNTHRYRTLGHDPVLGWIFGPINILSDSLTKSNFFTTYGVSNQKIGDLFENGTIGAWNTSLIVAQENKYNLPAAITKQAVHFGSDYFTNQGLPIPFVSSMNNDLSKTLINKFNIDTYAVTRGASTAVFINSIISCIHKLFYDEIKYDSVELYEVKTRKILLLSNTIATTSNVIYVALSKDYTKLDAGGALITLYRLINDTKFISKIKEEFINTKLDEDLQTQLDEIDKTLEGIV